MGEIVADCLAPTGHCLIASPMCGVIIWGKLTEFTRVGSFLGDPAGRPYG